MNKRRLWYLGFVFCAAVLLLIVFGGLPKAVDVGLSCAFGAVFGVTSTQLWYDRQVKKSEDFEIEIEDERNVQIKYRAGYLVCGVDMALFSLATVIFIMLDYTLSAVITGVILALQPVLLIVAGNVISKKL